MRRALAHDNGTTTPAGKSAIWHAVVFVVVLGIWECSVVDQALLKFLDIKHAEQDGLLELPANFALLIDIKNEVVLIFL